MGEDELDAVLRAGIMFIGVCEGGQSLIKGMFARIFYGLTLLFSSPFPFAPVLLFLILSHHLDTSLPIVLRYLTSICFSSNSLSTTSQLTKSSYHTP